jgi:hypothetical protein
MVTTSPDLTVEGAVTVMARVAGATAVAAARAGPASAVTALDTASTTASGSSTVGRRIGFSLTVPPPRATLRRYSSTAASSAIPGHAWAVSSVSLGSRRS